MIPILYDTNETNFTSNGLGRLRDIISCTVSEERNGIFECDFEYPVSGINYELIQIGRIIGVTHDESGDIEPFDIVSYTKPIDGVVTFHCAHISYRLSYYTVVGSSINSLADAFTLFESATPSMPFQFQTDMTSLGYLASADGTPRSVRQMMGGIEGSILDAYGGEYSYNNWTVYLNSSRGQLRNFQIRYGVNMLEYNEECDSQGTYSSCIPYWTNGEVTVVGDKVTAPESTLTGRDECVPLDVSEKFEDEPTKAEVEAAALSYMTSNNTYLPGQTIHIEFIRVQDMGELAEYENLFECNLCDIITVIFPDYGTSGQFKIVKTVWDVLRDRYESMELGDLSISLSEALGISTKTEGQSGSTTVQKMDYFGDITGVVVADKNLTSGTSWQNLTSFTLPDGVWIIFAEVSFASNTNGYRLVTISETTGGGIVLRTERRSPTSGAATTINITTVALGTTTYYINAVQNSGSTLTTQTRYTAIKVSEALGTNLKP